MPGAVLEPAIPMFERPKTVPALDRAAIETSDLALDRQVLVIYILSQLET
jgi:hypothetical protein